MEQLRRETSTDSVAPLVRAVASDDDELRAREIDEAIGGVLLATASALVVLGLVEIPRFGVWYAAWMSLPAVCIVLRRAALERGAPARPAALILLGPAFVACIACTMITGGTEAPGVWYQGLIALLGLILFPGHRWVHAIGVVGVGVVVGLDRWHGREVDSFDVAAALILAAAIPATVGRLLALEQLHRRRSVIDPLTGCLNRRALSARSAEIEEQAERVPSTVAVVAFDLDHFKRINDEHGHALGDRVLSHVAYVARRNLRNFDLVFRIGGEEFVVLLPGADLSTGIDVATRLRAAIAAERVEGVPVTGSFGVAAATSPFVMDDVLQSADREVYRAKGAGRDRVVAAGVAGSFGSIGT